MNLYMLNVVGKTWAHTFEILQEDRDCRQFIVTRYESVTDPPLPPHRCLQFPTRLRLTSGSTTDFKAYCDTRVRIARSIKSTLVFARRLWPLPPKEGRRDVIAVAAAVQVRLAQSCGMYGLLVPTRHC